MVSQLDRIIEEVLYEIMFTSNHLCLHQTLNSEMDSKLECFTIDDR